MDLKKVFDQTVREIKREVNKKVLKVPEIEQKVLDATSNEPWGPHGTLMAEIAQATRNYNEHQMVMGILWKRLNDSGRNWRHVYKALTVLEFLVANGAERVIDDLREHSYQVQTLIDFQHVEPNGKDQGVNVRKKAQTLVALINDKDKIREVRQKAAANRDKYKGMSSTGGIYKSSSYSSTGGSYGGDRYDYDDDNYGGGSRYGGRDDDRYGGSRDQDGDRYRDDDRHSREGDRYGRDGSHYRDDDYENDRDRDDERYGSKTADRYSKNYSGNTRDRDKDRHYDEDRYSMKEAEHLQEHGKTNVPPSYEELYTGSDFPDDGAEESRNAGERAGAVARGTKASTQLQVPPIAGHSSSGKSASVASVTTSKVVEDFADFDDFDPRANTVASVAPSPPSFQQDLFGESELQPAPAALPKYGTNVEDLFGESSFQTSFATAAPTDPASFANFSFSAQEKKDNFFESSSFNVSSSGPSNFFAPVGNVFPPPSSLTSTLSNDFTAFVPAPADSTTIPSGNFNAFSLSANNHTTSNADFGTFPSVPSTNGTQLGSEFFGDSSFNAFGPQTIANNSRPTPVLSANQPYSATTGVNPPKAPPEMQANVSKPTMGKFEPKSSVWADHLSSGLLDLNIGKPRNNPLAELGIHLDSSFATVEKKKEVVSAPGKAMGSGSGLGIVGASILNPPPPPPTMGGQMGLGGPGAPMGMSPGIGITPGMGYAVNPGMAMNPRMGIGPGFGMNMNPGMTQVPGLNSAMGMGINPSYGMGSNPSYGIGMGGYSNQQQQYGGFR